MIKIGMMIGDRYEILEKIGTGGMSDVYKAKCHKLNRFVAVKILKQEFSENANFVSKFRIEAQAAAGLMHPNIVNVYDVGEENGIYYIVMELVEGITLKKYIEKKARLSFKEAVSIAIQVSMGIEAAHNNHIIHRDIKPQNIIISKDGKVKVTDFGIAKAATSNTITSNVMGSVHYTSPEQARGGYSDEKSDIYSMGVTLFEMLTGRVPFNGETTVAIAIKHIQDEMPSPKEFVPEIPSSVEGIVLKCCQKSPDRRYQKMGELIADLKQALITPEEDFVTSPDTDLNGTTRMISDREVAQIRTGARREMSGYGEEQLVRLNRNTGSMRNTGNMRMPDTTEESQSYYDAASGEEQYEEEYQEKEYQENPAAEEDGYDDYDPKMERVTTLLAILAGVIVCGIIIFLLIKVFDVFGNDESKKPDSHVVTTQEESDSREETISEKKEVEVPAVAGWNVEDAKNALRQKNLRAETEYVESEEYDEDIVISTDIAEGSMVLEGTTIKLTVSSGVEGIDVPVVTGRNYEDAKATLEGYGFEVVRAESFSEAVAEGNVISQNPEGGTRAPQGSAITLTVSIGPEQGNKVMVPNVIGKSEMDATAMLIEAGLVLKSVSQVNHPDIPAGDVCYQSYSSGTYVEYGTTIDIHVSIGAATYKYNGSIEAPTAAEAPGYVPGSEVKVVVTADNGMELHNSVITAFPQPINFYGIPAAGATVTFTYTAQGDAAGSEGGSSEQSFTRRLEFTQE